MGFGSCARADWFGHTSRDLSKIYPIKAHVFLNIAALHRINDRRSLYLCRSTLFDTVANWFGWERNHYDKLGHFVQGFVPAGIAREILLRLNVVKNERWLLVFVMSVCLAFSAFYELIEWWVALAIGSDAEAFLGTQGYVWDTQSDMFMALIGSAIFLSFFRKWQNSSIRKLT